MPVAINTSVSSRTISGTGEVQTSLPVAVNTLVSTRTVSTTDKVLTPLPMVIYVKETGSTTSFMN